MVQYEVMQDKSLHDLWLSSLVGGRAEHRDLSSMQVYFLLQNFV